MLRKLKRKKKPDLMIKEISIQLKLAVQIFNLFLSYLDISTKEGKELGLSKGDIKKREDAFNEKRIKLKNPNYFVSPTRLCIRNLPTTMDEKALKKLLVINGKVGGKTPQVSFVKIARDKKRTDKNGVPRSKGFGFASFDSHDAALNALNKINNMSSLPFSKAKRAIVEFSVENSFAAAKMEELIQRAKKTKEENAAKGISSKSRKWKKRVQKFIDRRIKKREAKAKEAKEAEASVEPPAKKQKKE